MDRYKALALLIFLTYGCFSCTRPQKKIVSRGYYFWRICGPTQNERTFLKNHRIEKLYVHLLDVDWSPTIGAIPVTTNDVALTRNAFRLYDSFPKQLVPVIFITNKTFDLIDSADIPLLATRLVRRCMPAYDAEDRSYEKRNWMSKYYEGTILPQEIQFDCDWTKKTKDRYFNFLREVKKLLPDSVIVSATIRLHQYKYPVNTGVPPVDRGMLMMYNISDPKLYGDENSIFDEKKAAAYFSEGKKYPLPVDIVLPAWSWCIVYRNRQFYQVENNISEDDLNELSFLKKTGDHLYSVMQDTVYQDIFLRPGDEIKVEGIDAARLLAAMKLGKKAINTDTFNVSLFELSEKEIKNFNTQTIDEVYTSFR